MAEKVKLQFSKKKNLSTWNINDRKSFSINV